MKQRYMVMAASFFITFIMFPAQFVSSCGPLVISGPGEFEGTWQIMKKETVSKVDNTLKNQPHFNDEILHEKITFGYGQPMKVQGPGIFKNCKDATYEKVPAHHRFKGSTAEFEKAIKDKTIDLGRAELKLHCSSKDTSDVEVIFNMAISADQATFTMGDVLYTMQPIEP